MTREIKIDTVKKVLNEELKNKKLIRNLNKEFLSKGLNPNIPTGLFEQTLKFEELSINEQIAFVKGCYDILEWENLNPKMNFEEKELVDYKSFYNTDEEKNLKEMSLDCIQMIDDLNYTGRVSYKQITLFLNNVIWRYNPKTQRASTSKKLGTKDNFIREIDVNWNHVHDIADLILANDFESNQIIINILLTGDNDPDKEFLPYKGLDNIGRFIVRVNNDIDSEKFTVMNILDGYHRILAVREAFIRHKEKTGEELQGGLDIRIVMRTVPQAVALIDQIFKRSDTRKDFQKAIAKDNYNKFIDILGERSEVLKNNIETTFDECKIENKLTYKVVLKDTIKNCMNIDVDKIGIATTTSGKIAESIDMVITILKETYFNNDIEKMKNESFLLQPNIFAGYLAIANRIINSKNFYDYETLCEKLYNLKEEDVSNLRLNTKTNVNYKEIYNFFNNLTSGVIKVA